MNFYRYENLCLCPAGGTLPAEAEPAKLFAPLVFLVEREPTRGIFRIDSLAELDAAETVDLLRQSASEAESELDAFVREHGAVVLNTVFSQAFSVLKSTIYPKKSHFRVNLVGLGDVGGTVLTGLKLLGEELDEIGIYDPNAAQCQRYALELNQVLPIHDGKKMPRVVVRQLEELFDCDALLFTASLGVPAVGSQVADVRMVQYERNRNMLSQYAKMARNARFTGLFAQISDPVDHLCRAVFLMSNRDETGEFDGCGLLPEQIQGFGLGVMRARAAFYAEKMDVDFTDGYAFGPHGRDLIVANAVDERYDAEISLALTKATVSANLAVRDLGFKPYIAPGLSSAAISVLRTLRGQWHDGAVAFGGAYFGCRSRYTSLGLQLEKLPLHQDLVERMQNVHKILREFDYDG